MRLETTQEIVELLDSPIVSAALGSAMELGLFWLLAKEPLSASDVAQSLRIPLNRCEIWLQMLSNLGLLEADSGAYYPSEVARGAILDAQTQETWAFHARENRETSLFVQDLALNLGKAMSDWEPRSPTPSDYLDHIQEDPTYATGLTRKLCEIHQPLAEQLANILDLRAVKSLLDLGGGSGVVSFALLRKKRDLASVVVDVEKVCEVGRKIASEKGFARRVTYLAADLSEDELPSGFDMVVLCDVGLFSKVLFRRIHAVLNADGQLVVVDKFAPTTSCPPASRLPSAFLWTLQHPGPSIEFTTTGTIQTQLEQVGFRDISTYAVPHKDNLPWNVDWTLLSARK
jgi:SAM-dependent methyltransferase